MISSDQQLCNPKVQLLTQFYMSVAPPVSLTDLRKVHSVIIGDVRNSLHHSYRGLIPQDLSDKASFELLLQANIQSLDKKLPQVRKNLLDTFLPTLKRDKSVKNCFALITPLALQNMLSLEHTTRLSTELFYDFNIRSQPPSLEKCFTDLSHILFRVSQEIARNDGVNIKSPQYQAQLTKIISDELSLYFQANIRNQLNEGQESIEANKAPSKTRRFFNKFMNIGETIADKVADKINQIKTTRDLKVGHGPMDHCQRYNNAMSLHDPEKFSSIVIPQIHKLYHERDDVRMKMISSSIYYGQSISRDPEIRFNFLPENKVRNLVEIFQNTLTECTIPEPFKPYLSEKIVQIARHLPALRAESSTRCTSTHTLRNGQYGFGKHVAWNSKDLTQVILTIVDIYKIFSKLNYDGLTRWLIRLVIRQLDDCKYGFSNLKILMVVENLDVSHSEIMQHLREGQLILAKKILNSAILERLLEFQNGKKISFPMLELQKISSEKSASKVITICVSGFTSQDDLHANSWRRLIETHDGEVLALSWESKSTKDLGNFIFRKLGNLISSQLFKALVKNPILQAYDSLKKMVELHKDNPFNAAFEEAIITGKCLGHILPKLFPGHLVNLVGFSLGTQLIKELIQTMRQNNSWNIINKVLLIGGVADRHELEKTVLPDAPFQTINCYSSKDMVLMTLLKICKPNISACGTKPIPLMNVQNIDCSDIVGGHLDYRMKLSQVRQLVEMDSDCFYKVDKVGI